MCKLDIESTMCRRNDESTESHSLIRRLHLSHPYTLHATIELTHRCNLSCPHCCIITTENAKDELTYDEIISVFDQLSEMGILFLTLTGGEVTVRRDFLNITRAATTRRFVVTLKTNAATLSQSDVEILSRTGLYELNVSLYHTNPQSHDGFVRREGAFENSVTALRTFKRTGRRARASLIMMGWNMENIAELEQLCQDEGWEYSMDFRIEPRNDGSNRPAEYRAPSDAIVDVATRSPYFRRRVLLRKGTTPDLNVTLCGMSRSIVIAPDGDVIPCVSMPTYRLGNVREHTLVEIWNRSQPMRDKLNVLKGENERCRTCDLLSDCNRCPATAFIEHGDIKIPSPLDCQLAAVWRRIRLNIENEQ
jgi:radical SAM protein with 4Fe4S-binding SPASM domain